MASEDEIRQAFREQVVGGRILASPFTTSKSRQPGE
ncbi:Hypothetical protein NGAL_HAMBI490_09120 [Neorhizobium galegae bv. officinalis]|nr:Hypothetical protein NGAL_HAMBI490_09120 [Neorhizobium galegae bv. officinalis]